ncbi:peptidylprolyl isomerase [Ihuprevotella massiliensis]|uniref:peptidylprolyl isomerase n=1 Tax=Ihuprevotella massiliensis TaxID=1852368 RepID=UPI00094E6C0C
MKHLLVFFWMLCSTLSLVAQSLGNTVLATIDGKPISRDEFMYAYQKNKALSGQKSLTPQEYLNLYINYQLKVADALAMGLDTTKTFRREFQLYRDQQLSKKLVNPSFIDSTARAIYQKEAQQLNGKDLIEVSHILLNVPSTATAAQRDKVAQRADSLYQAVLAGADFAELARRYSEDKGTAQNGGQLPTLYPGMTVLPFEEAAYSLQPKQMSRPVLSPFGYHLILMRNRHPLPAFEQVYPSLLQYLRENNVEEAAAQQTLTALQTQTGQSRTSIMDSLARNLTANDIQLTYLIQEYHDGLLVYEVSKRNVWDAAEKDRAALEEIFKRNRKSLKWEKPRFVGYIVGAQNKKLAKRARKLLLKGIPADMDIREFLHAPFNKDSVVVAAKGRYIVQKGENSTIDHLAFGVKTSKVYLLHDDMPVTMLAGRIEKRPKSFEDARSEVLEIRQKQLEEAWLQQLRSSHRVTINQEVLKSIPMAR